MEKQLIKRFRDTFEGKPKWVWQYEPAIPLVGKKYKPGKGLLIYASAENLSWFNNETPPPRFLKEKVWNRYRICYEEAGRDSGTFFPDVGIQPVTDGGLFAAGLFISQKMKMPVRKTPRAFLETIAVSNWCKFSIKSKKNVDYINNLPKLTKSLAFVVGELVLLQPKVALLPKQLWKKPVLVAAMRGASPKTLFLPVPQFNSRVVNTHLKKYDRPAAKLKRRHRNTPLAFWMENLNRINNSHAWRYLAMLNDQS